MTSWRTFIACVAVLGSGLVACSDDPGTNCNTGGLSNCPEPRIGIVPATNPIEISESGLVVGVPSPTYISVINTGFATLDLTGVELEYEAPAGSNETEPAFKLGTMTGALPFEIEPRGSADLPQSFDLEIIYTRQDDSLPRSAKLVLLSNDKFVPDGRFVIDITTNAGAPVLLVTPDPVRFSIVPQGTTDTREVTLINTGSRTLHIGGFRIGDNGQFGVKSEEFGFDISGPEGIDGISLEEAIEILPQGQVTVTVTFFSDSISPAEGKLFVYSDDPTTGASGYVVELEANKDGACLQVNPSKVEFGGKKVGTVSNIGFDIVSCGTQQLRVDTISFLSGSSPDFTLKFTGLGAGFEDGPSLSNPITIAPGEKVEVEVEFVPDTINPRDADNVPIPDEGTIELTSNAYLTKVRVPVSGAGSAAECPTPIIFSEEGEEVIPQTTVHLDGTSSYAPFGAIEAYLWTLTEWPEGTPKPPFLPSATHEAPQILLNTVGSYTFTLNVVDEEGNDSGSTECPDATYTILVQPDQAIHIELTWVTPGDLDETDEGDGKGTDLDLHFAHANATGPDIDGDGTPDPWFDYNAQAGSGWDVFWFNNKPDWASLGPAGRDDPTLDRDDVDGGGPENLNLSVPEDGVTYQIGVHFWNDWNFGPVNATVKVFHYADEIYAATYDGLEELDMWCVGRINWPTVGVERCAPEGDPELVYEDYVNPFFRPPFFQ